MFRFSVYIHVLHVRGRLNDMFFIENHLQIIIWMIQLLLITADDGDFEDDDDFVIMIL